MLILLRKAARALHGRIDFNGLPISVENRMGSIRQWYDPHNGESGMTRMRRPYGYIKGTLGTDGDQYDVYVGPYRDAKFVYIVSQMKAPDFSKPDEEKALLGFRTLAEAKAFYLAHYNDPRFLGKITPMPFEEFKDKVMKTRATGGKALIKGYVTSYYRRTTGGSISRVSGYEKKNAKIRSTELSGHQGTDQQLRAIATERGYRVPPGWSINWVNKDQDGHLQVKAKDAKGREVRIYHPDYEAGKAREKFERMKAFAFAHNKLLKQIKADMATKEEAKVLYLISQTGFRIGSDSDTKAEKKAFGASNLLASHATVDGDKVTFRFTGKKGVSIEHTIKDKTIAEMIGNRSRGRLFKTTDAAVRKYMSDISGGKFMVKDFRTFVANETALKMMSKMPEPETPAAAQKAVNAVCDAVAAKLGNTRTVAKASYIAPEIWGVWKHAA